MPSWTAESVLCARLLVQAAAMSAGRELFNFQKHSDSLDLTPRPSQHDASQIARKMRLFSASRTRHTIMNGNDEDD